MTQEQWNAYFKNIAEKHKSIQHTTDRKNFFRANIEEILSGARSLAGYEGDYYALVLENHEGILSENGSDRIDDHQSMAFHILKPCTTDDFEKENLILKESKQIALDIVSRIRKDYRDGLNGSQSSVIKGFDINQTRYQKIGPVFDNCFGTRVEISCFEQISLKYDTSNWLD